MGSGLLPPQVAGLTLLLWACSWSQSWALGQLAACQATDSPLLWKVEIGDQHAWLLGSHLTSMDLVVTVPSAVQQAVLCSDVAYFDFACTPGENGGLGSYLDHCSYYNVSQVGEDSIALRLSDKSLRSLSQMLTLLAAATDASDCYGEPANKLRQLAQQIYSPDFRMTLRAVYLKMLRYTDPTKCRVSEGTYADTAKGGYLGWLREQFSTAKPLFGLSDIEERCEMTQGTTTEDQQLLRYMHRTIGNVTWREGRQSSVMEFSQALKCGNVTGLLDHQDLMHARFQGKRNQVLVGRLKRALARNVNRTVLFALDAGHMVDTIKGPGLPALLRQEGYTVTASTLSGGGCIPSTYVAPNAKEQGQCLAHPEEDQPQSCKDFMQVVTDTVGYKQEDEVMGRYMLDDSMACKLCENATQACTCRLEWANTSAFNEWCESLEVSGTSGQVLELQLHRNMGSKRVGKYLAQKDILGKSQGCYAKSCNIPLMEEMALRDWYKADPELSAGVVRLVPLQSPGFPWLWVILLLFLLLVLLVAGILGYLYCFKAKKPTRKRNVVLLPEEDDPEEPLPKVMPTLGALDLPRTPPFPIPWDSNHAVAKAQEEVLQEHLDRSRQGHHEIVDQSLIRSVIDATNALRGAGAEAVNALQQQASKLTWGPQISPERPASEFQIGPWAPMTGGWVTNPPMSAAFPSPPPTAGYRQLGMAVGSSQHTTLPPQQPQTQTFQQLQMQLQQQQQQQQQQPFPQESPVAQGSFQAANPFNSSQLGGGRPITMNDYRPVVSNLPSRAAPPSAPFPRPANRSGPGH